jgi:putative colanic acid biosysnthesis UDP-glucose lipid carrier transferase
MPKEGRIRAYEPLLMSLNRVSDALLAAASLLVFAWLYEMYTPNYAILAMLTLFITPICFHVVGIYYSWRLTSFVFGESQRLLAGCVVSYVVLFVAGYFLKVSAEFSRRVILIWVVFLPLLLIAERFTIRIFLRYQRQKGRNIRTCIIAGAGDLGIKLVRRISRNPWIGNRLLGLFDDKVTDSVEGYPIIGNLETIPEFVQHHEVDTIYLTLPMRADAKIKKLVSALADSTVSIFLIPDIFFFDLVLGGMITFFDDLPVVSLRDTPLRGINAFLKRAEDLVLSGIMLVAAFPLMLAIALLIKLTFPGPFLFKQWRYGLDGKPILIYKFRTMIVCEDGYQFNQVTKRDSRVTSLGAFLRRTSLDELPQLINVLQGRMSIVGPRPHPVAMNETYRKLVPGYMLRHKVRPGLTGLAQINGWRGETDTLEKMEKRIEDDLRYLRQWTLFLDLKIIFKTTLTLWHTKAY